MPGSARPAIIFAATQVMHASGVRSAGDPVKRRERKLDDGGTATGDFALRVLTS
jgi:hypothetical protein